MKPTLLVLAAGIGSRYGGLKQVEAMGPHGEVVLDYSVFDALRAGFGHLVFVVRRDIEAEFKEAVGAKYEDKTEVRYVYQELDALPAGFSVPETRVKPWGTGHATLLAERSVAEPFAVVNADDFYGVDAFHKMSAHLSDPRPNEYAMVGFTLRDTLSDHGHVARGLCEVDSEGNLVRITERTRIVKEGDGATATDEDGERQALTGDEIVSMNFWGFTPSIFPFLKERFEAFLRENLEGSKAEFYLPTAVDSLIANRLA